MLFVGNGLMTWLKLRILGAITSRASLGMNLALERWNSPAADRQRFEPLGPMAKVSLLLSNTAFRLNMILIARLTG